METFKALSANDPVEVGPYRIVARLGAGGMGSVYLGRSPGGRTVAVKVVRPDLAEDAQFRRRFAREVAAVVRVNGSFTAGVVDADPEGTPPWLATVYVPGMALGEAVTEHGPWPVRQVLALGAGLAEALEAIHAAGVVHRDLKPSNILLAPDGPRVIDFGISVFGEASRLTQTGMTVGTAGFMSPEQLTGGAIGPASDVFAFGSVLTYTATGTGPFGAGTAHVLHYRTVYERPALDALPDELRPLVAACLAKAPEDRPSVADLVRRLAEAAGGDTLHLTGGNHGQGPDWLPAAVGATLHQRSTATRPAEPPPPTSPPSGPPAGVTRRRALFGLAGVAAAGIGYGGWAALGDGGESGPDGTADTPAKQPGSRLWTSSVVADGGDVGDGIDGADQTDAVPAVAGGLVYVATRKSLYAVTADRGTRRWTYTPDLGEDTLTQLPAPAKGGTVCLGAGGALHAVRADTGTRKWTAPADGGAYAIPVVSGGTVYVNSRGEPDSGRPGVLYAVAAATGEERWRHGSAPGTSYTLGPAVADGTVCVGSETALHGLDRAGGGQKWTYAGEDQAFTEVTASGTTLYISTIADAGRSYRLQAISTETGQPTWQTDPDDSAYGSDAFGTPVAAGNLVYTSSASGSLYALHAKTGRVKWRIPLAETLTRPTLANGVAYVVGDGTLYAVDATTGRTKWTHATKARIAAPPAVANGTAYLSSTSGTLYAITL
ncbi:PQQ-binding-like beta-propeller repeat protein [Streptomyces sp. NPDC087851]|uniref:outer membrane protein assembly factor BamB family protein n=1 Tax=Streptomyces sp. NPDC087851 TaxID=3365810 RepID=UPI00382F5661